MKRIYTNFAQLVMSLTLVMLVGNIATAQCDIPPPEGSVWGTQFDGGLDGWTAYDGNFEERKRDDGSDIGWEWHAPETIDARIQDGAFAGNADAYASPSVCNGAVLLNSDFLDNQGIPTFASGDCPGPCSSILMSPTIDLSEVDASSFVLQMASQHRQFTSTYNVLISTDDGATWIDTVEVFSDGYVEALTNSPHLFNDAVRVPLCGLGNEREVRLAIWYNANYYYWILDDIHIIGTSEPDLQVNDNWYGTSVSVGTPADQEIPLAWIADISNQSPVASTGASLTVSVTKNGEEVHNQTLAYEAMDGCSSTENRVLPELFTPEADEGDEYEVTYTINDNESDSFESNNSKTASFYYTANEYIQVEPGLATREGRFGGTQFQSFGAGFKVNNGKDDSGNPRFLENVNFGIASDNADPILDGSINVTVYEWYDLDNDGDVDADLANEKVKVGDTTLIVSTLANPADINCTPRDDAGDKIALKDDIQYIVMTHYNPDFGQNAESFYRANYIPSELSRNHFDQPMEFAYVTVDTSGSSNLSAQIGTIGAVNGVTHDDRDDAREFFPVFWGTMHMNVELSPLGVGANDINENIGINVYPNPTAKYLTADVTLENISEVMDVEIIDINGRVVMTQTYSNVRTEKLTLDIQSLTDGIYVLNIKSSDGINSQKFTVQNVK